jgi:hypothetical protein
MLQRAINIYISEFCMAFVVVLLPRLFDKTRAVQKRGKAASGGDGGGKGRPQHTRSGAGAPWWVYVAVLVAMSGWAWSMRGRVRRPSRSPGGLRHATCSAAATRQCSSVTYGTRAVLRCIPGPWAKLGVSERWHPGRIHPRKSSASLLAVTAPACACAAALQAPSLAASTLCCVKERRAARRR